jgi:peptidoglycan/LPS O-acetylase OafA/YrhL
LLHTWSLAVEEQFYLIFPQALWGIFKYAKCYWLVILFSITLIGLLIAYIGSRFDPRL